MLLYTSRALRVDLTSLTEQFSRFSIMVVVQIKTLQQMMVIHCKSNLKYYKKFLTCPQRSVLEGLQRKKMYFLQIIDKNGNTS